MDAEGSQPNGQTQAESRHEHLGVVAHRPLSDIADAAVVTAHKRCGLEQRCWQLLASSCLLLYFGRFVMKRSDDLLVLISNGTTVSCPSVCRKIETRENNYSTLHASLVAYSRVVSLLRSSLICKITLPQVSRRSRAPRPLDNSSKGKTSLYITGFTRPDAKTLYGEDMFD